MSETDKTKETKTIPFYPDHLKTEIRVVWIILGIVLVIGIIAFFNPVGLEEPADPMFTPKHTKPEWYFLFLYEILKISAIPALGIKNINPEVWVSLIMVALVLLLILPFLTKKEDNKKQRLIRAIGSGLFMIFVIYFTLKGWYS